MALIYFYDATDLDKHQLIESMKETDHRCKFVEDKINLNNLDAETEAISIFVTSTVTREIIEKLPKLRIIACRSTGFNNVDMQATKERDITVVNVPTYGEQTVAEYTFTLLLALTRKLQLILESEKQLYEQANLRGHDLSGKIFGVIGTGHIGQKSIKASQGFSMSTIAYDPFPVKDLEQKLGFRYVSLDDLIAQADIISLHAPYLPTTHHIINAKRLADMKQGSFLINTSRGELIDTQALVDSLAKGHLGGAALDVIEGETLLNYSEEIALLRSHELPENLLKHSVEISVLQKMPNVIISPHNAFNTDEAVLRINQTTANNLIDFWYGKIPNAVKPAKTVTGKLLLARHTESEWNATGQWTGLTDVHLSENGFRQAAQLGLLLKNLDQPIDIAYCSEQIRTRETLEGVLGAAQMFDVDIVRDKSINERDYGDYTGKNKWEMKDILGEEKFIDLRRGWNVPIPNGETLKMVYERVVPFYIKTILPTLLEGKNVLIVAHGNSIRALMKYIESISNEDVEKLEMLFDQILLYTVNEHGLMESKNTAKLDSLPSTTKKF
jgi:D-lactate dehydrogenase